MSVEPRHFPMGHLPAVAEEIAEIFGEEGFAEPGRKLKIGPPLEAWIAGMVEPATEVTSLEDVARWTERFHHQVSVVGGKPIGYAVTMIEDGHAVTCEVSAAAELASALEKGLSLLRERADPSLHVRLLSVPEFQIKSLWTLRERGDEEEVMIVRAPESAGFTLFEPVTAEDLLAFLRSGVPICGAYLSSLESFVDVAIPETTLRGSLGEMIQTGDVPARVLLGARGLETMS